jgi:hypothetical protein
MESLVVLYKVVHGMALHSQWDVISNFQDQSYFNKLRQNNLGVG